MEKSREKGINLTLGDVRFIIIRFIHYLKLCLLNGYSIGMHYQYNEYARFELCYKLAEKIKASEKNRFFISTRMFGYIFYVRSKLGTAKSQEIVITPIKEFGSLISEAVNTDLAYKFHGR